MHGVYAIPLNFVVVDLGVAFNMRRRHMMSTREQVFGYLAKGAVLLRSKDVFPYDATLALPLGEFIWRKYEEMHNSVRLLAVNGCITRYGLCQKRSYFGIILQASAFY